jgi:NAD(P)-dependent dehydrogenase (short-subunit alcohol dehydrogenase family)
MSQNMNGKVVGTDASTSTDTSSPVWLITGCSSGFGRELARRIIQRGWRAIVTARDAAQVADLIDSAGDRALALALDVTKPEQIEAVVKAAKEKFGRIDVLVNNAGYGYQSTVEEGNEAEIRAQFDTNVFGLFALTRAVLPIMRAQRSGNIINISSVAGFIGFPGSGYYAASKHAIEGWSDSLRAEVEPLGIGVTCVEPGPFRTDWAGRSLRQTPNKIADYAETAGKRLIGTKQVSGTQVGDPGRASDIMIALTQQSEAPSRIVLGAWGFDTVTHVMETRLQEVRRQKDLSLSADFPK